MQSNTIICAKFTVESCPLVKASLEIQVLEQISNIFTEFVIVILQSSKLIKWET